MLRKLLLNLKNSKMQQHPDETIAEKGYGTIVFENILTGHCVKRIKGGTYSF